MEFYQVYLVMGFAMFLLMATEIRAMTKGSEVVSEEVGIPRWIMIICYLIVIFFYATFLWPLVIYNEWKQSGKDLG